MTRRAESVLAGDNLQIVAKYEIERIVPTYLYRSVVETVAADF